MQYYRSQKPIDISGATWQGIKVDVSNPNTLVTFGFQSEGWAEQLWASQIFVQDSHTGIVQLVNGSLTNTRVWIWCAVESPKALTADELRGQVKIEAVEQGEMEQLAHH
ncbi:hypothetical protein ACFU3E_06930 [Streptomyces sp. NPDC057424]|uniref:hypothetical protein n=1 Tax=Streptomyces sp. NPDC057424 TaxID=3346127 RepID=UPI003677C623